MKSIKVDNKDIKLQIVGILLKYKLLKFDTLI